MKKKPAVSTGGAGPTSTAKGGLSSATIYLKLVSEKALVETAGSELYLCIQAHSLHSLVPAGMTDDSDGASHSAPVM